MIIELGTTADAPNVIGKTVTWRGALNSPVSRDDFSAKSPTIIITGQNIDTTANYARVNIGAQTRYFFVDGIDFLTGNRTRIRLRVDVLETYRDLIGALSVVADRAASNVNRYIADSVQRTSAKPQIQYKLFEGNTPFISDGITSATRCIVVRAVAKNTTQGG